MDEAVLERAMRRVDEARAGGSESAKFEAALERSRLELETVTLAAAKLEETIPLQVGAAVREGLAREVEPVGRNLAEIRGLLNQAMRRLGRIEEELLAERRSRIEDLDVLVELVASGWSGVDRRLQRIEERPVLGEVVHLPSEQHVETGPLAEAS